MGLERSAIRPLALCIQCAGRREQSIALRTFTTSASSHAENTVQETSSRPPLDPFNAVTPRQERRLLRATGKLPVGSRRRRAASLYTPGIPFEQLPYQCFQEARSFLQEDRANKLVEIQAQRERIERLRDSVVVGDEAERRKEHRIASMNRRLEELKILADINDPLVKKKFEDGQGDLSKPIYRFLADRKWRSYDRKITEQRIEQFKIVPDILAAADPTVESILAFPSPFSRKLRYVTAGEFVDSRISEVPPNLRIQSFERGEKLVTIAVINPDIPNVETDSFDTRCHFLASNIPISALQPLVKLSELDSTSQILIPWLPAYAQKGAPYQRMSIIILEQPPAEKPLPSALTAPVPSTIDVGAEKSMATSKWTQRDGFNLRHFMERFALKPIGFDLFRTQWDEGTAGVMQRAGVPGWDVEFLRKRIDPMPYKRLKSERFR